ncbi:MAG: nucleotidyltransferase family protein [Streptosporangiaceae bacterium]
MITRTPAPDITEEARHVLAGCAAQGATARLLGGLVVALHQHAATPAVLARSYGDIDIVIGRKDGRPVKAALTQLGYVANDRFNALHGDRRLLFYDTANGRQLDVFLGTFSMCHALDLSGRLAMLADTLSIADLLLTKLQIVEVNRKDLIEDLFRDRHPWFRGVFAQISQLGQVLRLRHPDHGRRHHRQDDRADRVARRRGVLGDAVRAPARGP